MKKYHITNLVFLLAGFALAIFIWINNAPSWMMLENQSRYKFEETILNLEQSAVKAGWSVPVVHDLQKSLAKFGKETREVRVFALCNPDHAEVILSGDDERIVSSMMPCRVAVYIKSDGNTYISRMNSRLMSRGMQKQVRNVMGEAFLDMEEILAPIIKEN